MTAGAPPELAFVLAARQNLFFRDLVAALRFELDRAGVPNSLHVDEFPDPRPGLVTVLVPPHEYVALSGFEPPSTAMARTLVISAEQPDSGFFASNVRLGQLAGRVFDINARAVRAYRDAGIEATHLQLGHTEAWDRPEHREGIERDIDILFLGRHTDRRALHLARATPVLEGRACHLVLTDNSRPSAEMTGGFVADDHKLQLLRRAKVLINLHAEDEPYFEWLRVVEAVCCGCAVVSEHSTDIEPFVWGEHLLSGSADSLASLATLLVDDASMRGYLQREAHALLKDHHPLAASAQLLADAAAEVDRAPIDGFERASVRAQRTLDRIARRSATAPALHPPADPHVNIADRRILRALKAQQGALLGLRRRLDATDRAPHPATQPSTVIVPRQAFGPPRVTVIVPLYNHARDVLDTLASVRASTFRDLEVVVVDDASTDGGPAAVADWGRTVGDVPLTLVSHPVNRGLSSARNTGARHAAGELLLMLDADNEILPHGIERLVAALDTDRDAAFAYGILERHADDEGPVGLLSWRAWSPESFREGNYIDALALIRASVLRSAGGYSLDSRLALGWEDYDLWVRLAERGEHAAFVPNLVGRYRVGRSSMVSVTNLSASDAYAAIADHAPNLMRGVLIPGVGQLA